MQRTENCGGNTDHQFRNKTKKKQSPGRITPVHVVIDANDNNGYSGCVSSRANMVVMDEGASYLLWVPDPRQEQEQRQLEAVAERYD
jgi:hypothetical protein